jgi:hypothetical protein
MVLIDNVGGHVNFQLVQINLCAGLAPELIGTRNTPTLKNQTPKTHITRIIFFLNTRINQNLNKILVLTRNPNNFLFYNLYVTYHFVCIFCGYLNFIFSCLVVK